LNRHGRAGLKVTYCCVHTLRRLVSVKPEIIQRAPANRIGVLILRKCFAVPCYRVTCLSNSPRLAAIPEPFGSQQGLAACSSRIMRMLSPFL
jgi:hypothetical protein